MFKEIEVSTQAFQDKSGFTLKESYELNGLEYKMAFQKSIEILEKIGKAGIIIWVKRIPKQV